MNLPEKFKIQDGLVPEFVGRREFYEVVEELADMITWEIVLWSYALLWAGAPLWWWLLVCFFSLGLAIPAYVELEKWASEVYVVASDPHNGGGWVYKFKGVFNFSRQETPITSKAPVPVIDEYENNIAYWFWKKLTGRRMQKVTLKSEAGFNFLSGNRITPQFVKAIEQVRGTPANRKDIPLIWQNLDGLIRAKNAGIFTEQDARVKAEQLWQDLMSL